MQSVWRFSTHVRSYEGDRSGVLKPQALLNYFEEAAQQHARELGFGYEDILRENRFWILSRLKVRIHRPPVWGDAITVETWPKSVHRLFALRDFNLYLDSPANRSVTDGNGAEPIVQATSAWLLMDGNSERPLRPEKYLPEGPLRENAAYNAISDPPDKIAALEDRERRISDQVRVRFSDVDVNDHVNNSVYLRWLDDAIRTERHDLQLAAVELNFLKEASAGMDLRIHSSGENPVTMEVRTDHEEPVMRGVLRYQD
jgi:acyl-ACP thioesterase